MISEDDPGCPVTKVVCLENTQNYCGGRILPVEFIEKVASICKKYNMRLHLDGSRVMNAAIASNVDVKKICEHFDTVNFCCSKVIILLDHDVSPKIHHSMFSICFI
jgi:threonine aldolase